MMHHVDGLCAVLSRVRDGALLRSWVGDGALRGTLIERYEGGYVAYVTAGRLPASGYRRVGHRIVGRSFIGSPTYVYSTLYGARSGLRRELRKFGGSPW